MGVKGFAISTNHPFNRYKPGQTVRGKVHFNLDDPKTIRGTSPNKKYTIETNTIDNFYFQVFMLN